LSTTHYLTPLILSIGLVSLAVLPNSTQQTAVASETERCVFREASPAGQALGGTLVTNMTGNTTGNTTRLGEQGNMTGELGTPAANPAGISPGRGPQDKFLTD
jgi:hypothetical protein